MSSMASGEPIRMRSSGKSGVGQWINLKEAKSKADGVNWEDSDAGKLVLAESGSADGKWEAFRIWGFEEVGAQRRYTQSVKVWNIEGEEVKRKMVYDFVG